MPRHLEFEPPPRWTRDELDAARLVARDHFIADRENEEPASWDATVGELREILEPLFDGTANLRELDGSAVLQNPKMNWAALRYCCGPPVSEEDLWTYLNSPKFKSVNEEWAPGVAEAALRLIDGRRFPWIQEDRVASPDEVHLALEATAYLWANQQFATARRGAIAARQEGAVAEALDAAGLTFVQLDHGLRAIDDLDRGCYTRETTIAGKKCDVPARLPDGRLLAIECKASNGPKNGWKRLGNEVGAKRDVWRNAFGQQVLTCAVISGVFDLTLLEREQAAGTTILWEHNLAPLADFVRSCSVD